MKRGEIWTVSGGQDYAGKPRPAVIVQDDSFPATASITICPMTAFEPSTRSARQAIEPTLLNGLDRPSKLMVDKITTVPKTKLGRQIGCLEEDDVARLNRALIVFLGLAAPIRASGRKGDAS